MRCKGKYTGILWEDIFSMTEEKGVCGGPLLAVASPLSFLGVRLWRMECLDLQNHLVNKIGNPRDSWRCQPSALENVELMDQLWNARPSHYNFMSLLFIPLLISSAVPGSQTDPSQHNLNIEIPQNYHLPFNFGTPENMAQCSVQSRAWMNRCSQRVLPSWLPLSQVHHEWASRN